MRIEVRDLAIGYGNRPVSEHINMELTDGDICCLLGPNGVGKSTFFKTLICLKKPLSGQILMDGADITSMNAAKRARLIGYVAQAHVPSFSYTVSEMIMLGRMGQIKGQPDKLDFEAVKKAVDTVGIDYLKDKSYLDISGGERQLVMIARALVQNPKLIVLDEPTANLDYGNMIMVLNIIRKLADEGYTIVFATHSPDQAFYLDAKVLMMLRNEVPKFGMSENVITEKNMYDAYNLKIKVLEIIDGEGKPVRICRPYA